VGSARNRVPQAAETASTLGFDKVFILEGGIDAWKKADGALVH
jgi:rhodanese-related sulfurtransferase